MLAFIDPTVRGALTLIAIVVWMGAAIWLFRKPDAWYVSLVAIPVGLSLVWFSVMWDAFASK